MTGFEGLIAILIVTLMPVALVFISRYYALREKQLTARSDADARRIDELTEGRRLLEARVEALESIVCNVEFDLDQRLRRLPRAAARRALPPPAARRRIGVAGAAPEVALLGPGTSTTPSPLPRPARSGSEGG